MIRNQKRIRTVVLLGGAIGNEVAWPLPPPLLTFAASQNEYNSMVTEQSVGKSHQSDLAKRSVLKVSSNFHSRMRRLAVNAVQSMLRRKASARYE